LARRGVCARAPRVLTRTFAPAPGVDLEVSGRFHRIEHHYEYSYRVLAVVRFGVVLRDGP